MRTSLIISLLFFFTGCRDGRDPVETQSSGDINSLDRSLHNHSDNDIEINCDSIFRTKGLKIVLTDVGEKRSDENSRVFAFKFSRNVDGHATEIFNDTIESSTCEILFSDFNGDAVKDILVQNHSDARSNWTYHLFLVDAETDGLKKVRGFEEIKNPTYLTSHDIVTNYVNSGTNWTGFYKIQADSVIDLGVLIEDDLSDDGSYKRKYDQAIADLGQRMKNNR